MVKVAPQRAFTAPLARHVPHPLTPIVGRKGKAGGKKGNANAMSNTLRSKARARMVEIISEGVIEGLVNGNKSIYFDQTPLQNADGSYNFNNVNWYMHNGWPDEGYFYGHEAVQIPYNVEVQVKMSIGPVQRTIVEPNADAVKVIIRLPALAQQDEDSGQVIGADVSYAIDVRGHDGSWQEAVVNNIINEKTSSPYQIQHRVELPLGGCPWDIRVRRLSLDSVTDTLANETWWESYTVLVEGKFIYPHSAGIAVDINAEDIGQNIPTRAYHVRGIRVQVPSNYDPIARTYTGIWNGTFKTAWTNNPAWIFYDLITNRRYGLGEFIRPETVDKWSLYAIARHCDELVKSGYKNADTGADIYEPRYTFNGVINTRADAYTVLQRITTAFRGMAYWSLGQVFATADMPSDPVTLVTPANVIGGAFAYSGTATKSRHSVVYVKWNDPDDFYRPATEIVIDPVALARYGWRDKPVQLDGCTSRGLAHRYGKWILDVEQNETETVEYKASLDHIEMRPGDIIAIADPRKAQVRLGGRIVSHENRAVVLDWPFAPAPGQSYQLLLTMPNGEVVANPITSFTGTSTVNVQNWFPDQAVKGAIFIITGTDIEPRRYRVLSIEEEEKNVFKVTGLFHDPDKYDRVEKDMKFDPRPYSRPANVVLPPANLSVKEVSYVDQGAAIMSLTLSWSPPVQQVVTGYVVSASTPKNGRVDFGNTRTNSIRLENIDAGDYTFYVSSVNQAGAVSAPASFFYSAMGGQGFSGPTVTELRLSDRPTENTFVGRDVNLAWHNNFSTSTDPLTIGSAPQHVASPHYDYNTVLVYDHLTGTLLRTQQVYDEAWTYTYDMNKADSLAAGFASPRRNLDFMVKVRDVFGRESPWATRNFLNPPPSGLNIAPQIVSASSIVLGYNYGLDNDRLGWKIWRQTTPGVDTTAEPYYSGPANPLTLSGMPDTTYYFKAAAYDAFGDEDLNISVEFMLTTLGDGFFGSLDVVPIPGL